MGHFSAQTEGVSPEEDVSGRCLMLNDNWCDSRNNIPLKTTKYISLCTVLCPTVQAGCSKVKGPRIVVNNSLRQQSYDGMELELAGFNLDNILRWLKQEDCFFDMLINGEVSRMWV